MSVPDDHLSTAKAPHRPLVYGDPGAAIPTRPWPDKPDPWATRPAEPPESLLERRAWEALMQLVKRDGYCSSTSIQHSFTIAEMFAAEAAKRRGGS